MYSTHEIFKVVNIGDTVFKDAYSNVPYVIQPGGEKNVPFGAVVTWFGSPNARNHGPGRMDRQGEFERLCTRYGAHEDPDNLPYNAPKCLVYDSEGKEVMTVLADPEGLTVSPAEQTGQEALEMQQRLAAMERQLAELTGGIVETPSESNNPPAGLFDQAVEQEESIPEDVPVQPGVQVNVPWVK